MDALPLHPGSPNGYNSFPDVFCSDPDEAGCANRDFRKEQLRSNRLDRPANIKPDLLGCTSPADSGWSVIGWSESGCARNQSSSLRALVALHHDVILFSDCRHLDLYPRALLLPRFGGGATRLPAISQ